MRSSKITADVRAFFTSYCTAFIRQDAPAIARHFADLVHVASDAGDDVNVHVATAVEMHLDACHAIGQPTSGHTLCGSACASRSGSLETTSGAA